MKGHLPVICCLPHARERVAAPAEPLDVARRAIEAEIAMASDPDGKDQFEKGALAAYHFALSVLSPTPKEPTDD